MRSRRGAYDSSDVRVAGSFTKRGFSLVLGGPIGAAFKIEAANPRGQAGGLKSRFHVATPDWQGVTGWHGLLVGGRTVDPNQWSAESPASFCQRTGIAASFSARAALLGDAKVS